MTRLRPKSLHYALVSHRTAILGLAAHEMWSITENVGPSLRRAENLMLYITGLNHGRVHRLFMIGLLLGVDVIFTIHIRFSNTPHQLGHNKQNQYAKDVC